jgi:hypothetical protein
MAVDGMKLRSVRIEPISSFSSQHHRDPAVKHFRASVSQLRLTPLLPRRSIEGSRVSGRSIVVMVAIQRPDSLGFAQKGDRSRQTTQWALKRA